MYLTVWNGCRQNCSVPFRRIDPSSSPNRYGQEEHARPQAAKPHPSQRRKDGAAQKSNRRRRYPPRSLPKDVRAHSACPGLSISGISQIIITLAVTRGSYFPSKNSVLRPAARESRVYARSHFLPGSIEPPPDYHMSKRVLLVDDNTLTRSLIRAFLESQPEVEVCGEASDGAEGLEKGLELKPDLVVLDFSMPGVNGLQAAFMLHKVAPSTPIILFTLYRNEILERLAHSAGVASVVSKADEITVLADEVQRLTSYGPH